MRLCRFDSDRVGLLSDSGVHDVTPALSTLAAYRYPLPMYDVLIEALPGLRESLVREAQRVIPVALGDIHKAAPCVFGVEAG